MLSRALILATVTLLIGCCAAENAQAQENLDAGKSPSQIFAGTCTACHKSPRGLLKTVPPGSLSGFLRQHYTTSPDMAGVLASYLISNGATDTRLGGAPKGAKEEAKQEAKPEQADRFGRKPRPAATSAEAKPENRPDNKPENEGLGRNARRLARPAEPPEAAKPDADLPPPLLSGDGSKLSAKQRLSKRGKPGAEEPPKADEPPVNEAPKAEAKSEPKGEPRVEPKGGAGSEPKSQTAAKEEGRPVEAKPTGDAPSGAAGTPSLRADPVPPVTPAPPAGAASATPAPVNGGAAEPAVSAPAVAPAPPAITASAPPLPPVAPAGPPAPPISQ